MIGNDPQEAFKSFDKRVSELTVSKVNDAITKYLDDTKMIEISCG